MAALAVCCEQEFSDFRGHQLNKLHFNLGAWVFTLGGECVSSGIICGVFVGSCGELMGVEGMDLLSFSIRLGAGRDKGLETGIRTGAAVTGRGVIGARSSGGGFAVGWELSMIVWKTTPSFSMAYIAASPMLEKGADIIVFVKT